MDVCADDRRLSLLKKLELPTIPIAAQRLLALFGDEDLEVEELARTIELDPALTARIIGLARSAYFSNTENVYTVKDAIIHVLGLDMVKSLAISISLNSAFELEKGCRFDMKQYWTTAMLTAALANLLVPHIKLQERPERKQAYLGGLLHNIGFLALAKNCPMELAETYRIASGAPEWTLSFVENEVIGIDHHTAGGWLAHRWNLPTDIIIVMENYHFPEYRGQHWGASMAVGFCSRFVQWRVRNRDLDPIIESTIRTLAVPEKRLQTIFDRFEEQFEGIVGMAESLAMN